MELLQLRYFYEVAKNQHVSNTAKLLHVSQPSLTQTIHRLEAELGVKLFKSSGRNIILTEYGEYLKRKIEPVIETLDSIPDEIAELARLNKNTICLNVLAASTIAVDALIAYQEINNHIKFRIIQNTRSEEADITISTSPFYQKTNDNTYTFSEQIFMAVPWTSEYADCESIELSEMKENNFISLAGSKALRQICDMFCIHSGFRPKIIFESDSPAAVRNMIGANLGIGFWPQYSWGSINEEKVKLIPIRSPKCRRDIIIIQSKDESKNNFEETEKFFAFLTSFFENLKNETE